MHASIDKQTAISHDQMPGDRSGFPHHQSGDHAPIGYSSRLAGTGVHISDESGGPTA